MIGLGLPQGTALSAEVDTLFLALLAVSGAVLLLVFGLMVQFGLRFHVSSGVDRGQPLRKSWRFEVVWTGATLLGFLGLFVWGADLFVREQQTVPGAVTVDVVGKQWMWKIEHPEGQREINALHVPVNRAVSLRLTSEDVIHDFGIPAFRLRHDVVPGRVLTLNFTPQMVGTFPFYCDQFCGTDHASMVGGLVVLSEPDYERWLEQNGTSETQAVQGARLFDRFGCGGCHSAGGSQARGTVRAPPLDGLYGSPVPLADGSVVIADDRYIHDSIVMPRAQVVASYEPVMPSFAGVIEEEDLMKIVAFIKSLAVRRPSSASP